IFAVAPGLDVTWTALRDLVHPDDRAPVRHSVLRAIDGRGPFLLEFRLMNGGRERWVLASGRARFDGGRLTGMYGVLQDLTGDRLLVRMDDAARALVDAEEVT